MGFVECIAFGGPKDGEVVDLDERQSYYRVADMPPLPSLAPGADNTDFTSESSTVHEYVRRKWVTGDRHIFWVLSSKPPDNEASTLAMKLICEEFDRIQPNWPRAPLRVTVGMMELHREFMDALLPFIAKETRRRAKPMKNWTCTYKPGCSE